MCINSLTNDVLGYLKLVWCVRVSLNLFLKSHSWLASGMRLDIHNESQLGFRCDRVLNIDLIMDEKKPNTRNSDT